MAFVTLSCTALLLAFSCRSLHHSAWSIGLFSNGWMWLTNGSSFLLLMIVVYVPFLAPAFHTVSLGLREWEAIVPLIFLPVVAFEIAKFVLRRGVLKHTR